MTPCNCCETTCDHGPDACNGLTVVEEGFCDSCTTEIFGKSLAIYIAEIFGYGLATYRNKSTGLS